MNYGKILAAIIGLILAYFHFNSEGEHLHQRHPRPYPHQENPPVLPTPSWKEALNYAEANLPHEGVLKRKADGFTYLRVDDRYIKTLFPMLNLTDKGFREPPYYRTTASPGAHVSVFYGDEKVVPSEIGQTYPFTLKQITIVHPSKKTSYVILEVDSPELEALRKKYGLSPKLKGHEFHISLGKKMHFQSERHLR